jgi:hypothetical protein
MSPAQGFSKQWNSVYPRIVLADGWDGPANPRYALFDRLIIPEFLG